MLDPDRLGLPVNVFVEVHLRQHDEASYEHLLGHRLVHLPAVASLSSTFALRQVKYTARLPL